jgi:Ran GTPase-activating protein (RanGAP) involved in mRNA processing and transport
VITELNISSNELAQNSDDGDDISGVIAIADAIPDMGALTKLDISKNILRAEGSQALAGALTGNNSITELSLAGNQMGLKADATAFDEVDMSGVAALADVIPGMGALTKLNISNNNMEQGQALQQITECCSIKSVELDSHNSNDGDR